MTPSCRQDKLFNVCRTFASVCADGTGTRVYTVKQVAALTGVSEATLRAWERRYGIVAPTRSPGGYRLYDDEHVGRLRRMAALVDAGVPASHAARATLAEEPAAPGASENPEPDGDLIDAAASLDPARLHATVAAAFAAAPFEQVADHWLRSQLDRLGRAWASGRLSVAEEHFASAGLLRAMAATFDAAPDDGSGPNVVVGLPPGARHELALFAFATCLRRRGTSVVYLGADVPVDAWERAVADRRARAAVLGVTARREVPKAQAVVDALRAVTPPVSVWVGGSHRHGVRGAHLLTDEASDAAATLHATLSAGGA